MMQLPGLRQFYRRYIFRHIIFPLKKFFLRRRFPFYLVSSLCILVSILMYILATYIINLTYEPEITRLLPSFLLKLMIAVPLSLMFFIIIISIKILVDRIRGLEGTRIRFKLILYFLTVTLIPSILFIFLFSTLINTSINTFFEPDVVKSLGDSLDILKENIHRLKGDSLTTLSNVRSSCLDLSAGKPGFHTNRTKELLKNTDYRHVYLFNDNMIVNTWSKSPPGRTLTRNIRRLKPSRLIREPGGYYSEYSLSDGYIINILPAVLQPDKKIYLAGVYHIKPSLSRQIRNTLNATTSLKQFQILKVPIKNSLIFIYIYFFIPIISIGILFFYYKSNQITRPLGQLSEATQQISRGDYSVRIPSKGNDEIQELVRSFKQMTSELMYNRIKLSNISHIEAWKDVALKLAHELKNPLTPILHAVEKIENAMMKENFDTYSNLNDSFNLIKRGIENISLLIIDFSKFSRDITIERHTVEVMDILSSLREELSHYPDVRTELKIEHKEACASLDERKVRQVLTNLLQNAYDSLQETVNEDKYILVLSRIISGEKGRDLVLKIEDNGRGIAIEKQQRIFEPYFTTKKSGTGLGLTICERIITGHNGRIHFESSTEKTVFTIILPLDG